MRADYPLHHGLGSCCSFYHKPKGPVATVACNDFGTGGARHAAESSVLSSTIRNLSYETFRWIFAYQFWRSAASAEPRLSHHHRGATRRPVRFVRPPIFSTRVSGPQGQPYLYG